MIENLSPNTALSLIQTGQIDAAKSALQNNKNAQRIQEAAQDFEAVFLSEMLKPMFEGIETDELFGGGKGEEIFRGVLLQEYGKEIAKKDMTHIQTQVQNKLIEMQAERTTNNETIAIQNGAIKDLEIIEDRKAR